MKRKRSTEVVENRREVEENGRSEERERIRRVQEGKICGYEVMKG